MNTSGFTFRPLNLVTQDNIPGLQFGFSNDYGVSVMPDCYSEDIRFEHATVSVNVFKGATLNDSEDKTAVIMEKMGYTPTGVNVKTFTKVSPEYLLKILQTVSEMEIQ